MKKFDHIISLGRNCEPSFQMSVHLGFVESFPLSWCYIHDETILLKILKDNSILFSGEIEEAPSSNMWLCKETNINFHAQRKAKEFRKFKGDILNKEKEIELQNLKDKISYLFTKLEKVWASNESQRYIITIDKDHAYVMDVIKKLNILLEKKSNNYSILVILPLKNKNSQLHDSNNIFFRYVSHFSPIDHVTDLTLCDLEGWGNIFSEFGVHKYNTDNKKYKFSENYSIFKYFYYHIKIKFYSFIYTISSKKSRKIKNNILKYSFKLRNLR